MTASPPDAALDAIRRDIDSIDGQILDLLVRRFAATERVRATKAQDGSIAASPFRPAREAIMLRRLIGESDGTVAPDVLVRLWRVILSASIQSQAKVTLHLDGALGQDVATRILVAQHFCGMTVELHRSPSQALAALGAARGDLALVAPNSDWASEHVRIGLTSQVIGTLPAIDACDAPQLLILGHVEPQPSGDDETLLIHGSAATDLPAVLWQARSGTRHVTGVRGFLAEDDLLFTQFLSLDPTTRIAGRYPRPIKVSP